MFGATCGRSVNPASEPLLDAIDHLCHQVEGDPAMHQAFFSATTPEEIDRFADELSGTISFLREHS